VTAPAPSLDLVAIVLAGGASSRFGSDKLGVAVGGRPLLHHALAAVGSIADHIVVVIAPEAPLPSFPVDLAGRVVFARDAAAHGGPLAGLAAGLAALDGLTAEDTPVRDEAPRITGAPGGRAANRVAIVVGGDMPTLVPDVLQLLGESLAGEPSIAAMTLAASRPAPLPMALRPEVAQTAIDAILASGGRRSLIAILDAIPSVTLPAEIWRALDPAGATLRDVDTPADLGTTDTG